MAANSNQRNNSETGRRKNDGEGVSGKEKTEVHYLRH